MVRGTVNEEEEVCGVIHVTWETGKGSGISGVRDVVALKLEMGSENVVVGVC